MLNPEELKIHERLRGACAQLKTSGEAIVVDLLKAARLKYYRKLGRRNLVEYIIEDHGIDSTFTLDLNRVVEAALNCPELERALRENQLTVGKATRILGTLKPENAKELVAYASTHTFAQINQFIRENNPKANRRERWKQLSADQFEVVVILKAKQFKDLQRVQSLEAQKQKASKMSDAVGVAFNSHLWRNDPVQKAARAHDRRERMARTINAQNVRTMEEPIAREPNEPIVRETNKPLAGKTNGLAPSQANELRARKTKKPSKSEPNNAIGRPIQTGHGRIRLTAAEIHAVVRKTGGRCTFIDAHGKCCRSDRWLDIHHIVPVSAGGTNDLSNLTHLCGFHHDLTHQLSLPLEGQITWWRAGATPKEAH